MEILTWISMIVGIFILIFISVKMLLNSEEKRHLKKKKYQQLNTQITQTNKELDALLEELESHNSSLEKVRDFFVKVNTRIFK